MKDSVIIYRSFYEALTRLPDSDFAAIFRAIIEYGLNEVEKEIPEHLMPFYILIQPQIKANVKRHSDGMKGAEYGLKGGRPKKYENTTEEKNPIPLLKKTPVGLLSETPKEKEKENVKEKVKVKENAKENNIPFADFWNLYDKKINAKKSEEKWNKLTDAERILIMDYLPKYKLSKPDKQYRKNPDTFLNNKSWNDEIIMSEPKDKHGSQPEETKYITPISKIPR